MIETLPIPFDFSKRRIISADIDKPKTGILADSHKIAKSGDYYAAMSHFIWGCCKSLIDVSGDEITDRIQIKQALRLIPYRSAEIMGIRAMLLYDKDDGIEGVYICPRCGKKVIAQYEEEDGEVVIDTRDFISQLDIHYCVDTENIEHTFTEPVQIINAQTKEPIEVISSIEMKHPNLQHCMNAFQKHGNRDDLRMQCGIYVEALQKVNNSEVDQSWKNKFGMIMFENIGEVKEDLVGLTKKVMQYGIDRRVEKSCLDCGKIWKAMINTSNFFGFEGEL